MGRCMALPPHRSPPGSAARTPGHVLWRVPDGDLFALSVAQACPPPDRVISAEVGEEEAVLACLDEGLCHDATSAVLGKFDRPAAEGPEPTVVGDDAGSRRKAGDRNATKISVRQR